MRRHAFTRAVAAALVLTWVTSVAAQQGADVVTLRNGGMLRGTLVAVEPDKGVTVLVLGTTTPRTLPWSEIARVDRGQVPPIAERPAAAQPQRAPLASAPGPGTPWVHIQTRGPVVTLYRIAGEVATTDADGSTGMQPVPRPVCVSPCDRVVDGRAGEEFYFGGPRIVDSSTFQLARWSGSVVARVEPGESRAFGAGLGLTIAGPSLMASGLGMALGGFADGSPDGAHPLSIAGGVAAIVGVGALVAGIVIFRGPGRTTFGLSHASRASSGLGPRPSLSAGGLGLIF